MTTVPSGNIRLRNLSQSASLYVIRWLYYTLISALKARLPTKTKQKTLQQSLTGNRYSLAMIVACSCTPRHTRNNLFKVQLWFTRDSNANFAISLKHRKLHLCEKIFFIHRLTLFGF